jgi:hypothetical protein
MKGGQCIRALSIANMYAFLLECHASPPWPKRARGAHMALVIIFLWSCGWWQAILSQFQRLPGLKSSFAGLETLMGRDEKLEFGDYLGNSEMDKKPILDLHAVMEARMGEKPSRFA